MKNWQVTHSGKEHVFLPKGIDKLVFDGECCLFFSTQLPSSVCTSNTIQVVIIWETEVFVM